MLFLIFSIAIFALMMLSIVVGVLRGRKYVWTYSAIRLANVVVSAVVSLISALLIGKFAGGVITELVLSILPSDLAQALRALPSTSGIVGAFVAMFLAPIVFLFIFLFVRGIISLFVPMISCAITKNTKSGTEKNEFGAKKVSKKQRLKTTGANPIGMVIGGICGLLMFIVIASPITAYATVANGVMMMAGSGEDNFIAPAVSVTEAAAENVGTKTVRVLGGDLLVSGMTSYKLGGQTSNLIREGEVIVELGEAVYFVRDTSCNRVEAAIEVREIGDAVEEARFIPSACAELLDSASTHWANGEKYAGMNAPASEGTLGKLTRPIYESFEGSTGETFKKDAHTLANIVACLVEFDVIDGLESDPMSILKNESVTQKVIFEFLDNERLNNTVSGVVDFGISAMCEKIGVRNDMSGAYEDFIADLNAISTENCILDSNGIDPQDSNIDEEALALVEQEYSDLFDKYAITVADGFAKKAALADLEGNDMAQWLALEGVVSSQSDMESKSALVTIEKIKLEHGKATDKAIEAAKLARALCETANFVELMSKEHDTVSVVTEIGALLDAFSNTDTVGEFCTAKLLTAILQSDKITEDIGYKVLEATNLANAINEGATKEGGYSVQMRALGKTVDIVKKSSQKGDTKSSVKELLQELTPESAKTMQSAATPNVMKQNGVPEQSAVPASNMVSDMFGNLSDAKSVGMSDDQLERETAAVNNVLNIAINMDMSNSTTFGEGSATGISVSEYVDDILNSEVVSKTVVDHVYGDGDEPKTDPLNSTRAVSEAEEAELIAALNAKWQSASAAEKASGMLEKQIIATASLVNVSVSVTDAGVVKA